MIVYIRKRLSESIINYYNERINRQGLTVIQSEAAEDHDDGDQNKRSTNSGKQQVEASKEPSNQVSLLIDATCAPADVRYPTDLSLFNVDAVFS